MLLEKNGKLTMWKSKNEPSLSSFDALNAKLQSVKHVFSRFDDDIYEDELHLNQTGTTRLMKELGKTIEGLLRDDRVTSNCIYSRVATEYPWGCNFCCKEGHDEEQ